MDQAAHTVEILLHPLGIDQELVDIRTKVVAGIQAGRSLAEIQASKPAAPYGMPDGFIKPDGFVETVYNSLKNPPKDAH
jgi:hypothetical protein